MPAIDWTQPPLPPPGERPERPTGPSGPRRRMRLGARAMGVSLVAAAAVGTGALAADLTAQATTTTGATTPGFAQAAAPGSTSGSSAVHASSGGS